MSISELSGLIGSIAFFILSFAFIIAAIFIAKFFNRTANSISELCENTIPLLTESTKTVSGVNSQIENIDKTTASIARTTNSIASLVDLWCVVLSTPLSKINKVTSKLKSQFTKKKHAKEV